MRNNFVISTDIDGKMPVLSPIGVPLSPSVAKHHRYWVEYRNNKPARIRPYPNQSTAWDYSENRLVNINDTSIEIVN